MVKLFSLKSPDEWATTKQACRDTYVVTCFLPSTIRILALLYVLSTVLRISSSNLLYCSESTLLSTLRESALWKNSISATPPRIFPYHHATIISND